MNQSSWTDGYSSEIEYTSGYYGTQSPLMMKFALLTRGLLAPDIESFRYMELGFGQGVSLNIHAAGHGQEFWGTDFNPQHAASAAEFAKSSGSNLRVLDDSFEDLLQRDDMPMFDFISMHGIWSWISEKNQQAILDLLKRKLNVGGVLQVSYNCYPGWAAMVPLQHMLMLHKNATADKTEDPRVSLQKSMAFIDTLAEIDAGFFQVNPEAKKQFDDMRSQNMTYLVHELMHDSWPVTPFSKVEEKMASVKLNYACPAQLIEHLDVFNLAPKHIELVNQIGDVTLRESVRDYCMNRRFRSDIFVKGVRQINKAERDEALRKTWFVLMCNPELLNYEKIEFGNNRSMRFKPEIIEPLIEVLMENEMAAKSVAEIEQHKKMNGIDFDRLAEIFVALSAAQVISPALSTEKAIAAEERCKTLNKEILRRAMRTSGVDAIASPTTAGGFGFSHLNMYFMSSIFNGNSDQEAMVKSTWENMQKRGERGLKDGKQLETEEDNLKFLNDEVASFIKNRMPIMKAHRII